MKNIYIAYKQCVAAPLNVKITENGGLYSTLVSHFNMLALDLGNRTLRCRTQRQNRPNFFNYCCLHLELIVTLLTKHTYDL